MDERPRVQLVFISEDFGTGKPTFGRFGPKEMKGRGHFGNFFADGFRTSGLSLSFSAPSKVTDELWVDTKFHPPNRNNTRTFYL